MEVLSHIIGGFAIAMQPGNLMFLFIGALLGTMIGMLPGIGASTGIALLLPMTFGMDPLPALIMLAGIYYGNMYGNTAAAILINTPGSASAAMTTLDGNPMARAGRGGAALAIAAIASFIAGTIGIVLLSFLAIPFTSFALGFGPAEYFTLMLFAMTSVAALTGGSVIKGLIAASLGLMIGTVGIDLQSGLPRYTMGVPQLQDGIPFLIVIVGLFAFGEVLMQVERYFRGLLVPIKIQGKIWFTREEWRRAYKPIFRGGLIGFLVGVLPGGGGAMATVIAYSTEKRISSDPDKFGKGAIEGVAAPEAANNASTSGAFVPLLTLGVPGSGTTAVLLAAFIMFGIQPGPQLFQNQPELVWGLIDSMYLGNVILLVLNLPLIAVFARILYTPPGLLMPMILGIATVGIFSLSTSIVDLYLLWLFGAIGYAFRKLGVPAPPLILGVILGDQMEQRFRQAMTLSGGELSTFVSSPITVTLLFMSAIALFLPLILGYLRRRRRTLEMAATADGAETR